MAEDIEGFPVTVEQIKKHLNPECLCCIAGNMRRRKVSNDNFFRQKDQRQVQVMLIVL